LEHLDKYTAEVLFGTATDSNLIKNKKMYLESDLVHSRLNPNESLNVEYSQSSDIFNRYSNNIFLLYLNTNSNYAVTGPRINGLINYPAAFYTANTIKQAAEMLDSNCREAFFTYAQNGLNIAFDAKDKYEPDVKGILYSWNFGDGTTLETTEVITPHTYKDYGDYDVKLIVKYPGGEERTVTKKVSMGQISYDVANDGLAQIRIENYSGASTSFKWTFGDGTTEITDIPQAEHKYDGRGTRELTVEFLENDIAQKMKTNINVYMAKVVFEVQPYGDLPVGESLVYNVKCDIGEMTLINSSYIKFYSRGLDSGLFNCTGVNRTDDSGVNPSDDDTHHTITCTAKKISCLNNFTTGNIRLNVLCNVFDGDIQRSTSDSELSDTVSAAFNCN
jgi:PKD repeat protein